MREIILIIADDYRRLRWLYFITQTRLYLSEWGKITAIAEILPLIERSSPAPFDNEA